MKQKLTNLLTEYGAVAIVLYFVIFGLVFAGVWFALKAGWAPASASGKASTLLAAYLVTKLTQPLRIGATVVLTPFVAKGYDRITGRASRDLPSQSPRSTE